MITYKQLSLADIFTEINLITIKMHSFPYSMKLPDASKFTRFKQDFLPYLQSLFERLVDLD